MSRVAEIFSPANRQRCISLLRRLAPVRPTPDGAFGSAVIIPLCYYDRRHPAILFTKRSLLVRHYPGEISFPGGRMEPNESVVEAALRELEEEVGIPPSFVDPWTTFAPLPTRAVLSLIHPLVGFIGNYDPLEDSINQQIGGSVQSVRLRPSPHEVDMIIFRSINWLANPACRKYCVYRENPRLPFTGVTNFLGSPCPTSRKFHKNATLTLPVFEGPSGCVELPRITGATALLTYQLLTCLLPQGLL